MDYKLLIINTYQKNDGDEIYKVYGMLNEHEMEFLNGFDECPLALEAAHCFDGNIPIMSGSTSSEVIKVIRKLTK